MSFFFLYNLNVSESTLVGFLSEKCDHKFEMFLKPITSNIDLLFMLFG